MTVHTADDWHGRDVAPKRFLALCDSAAPANVEPRGAICNRVAGHGGPHREYDRASFKVQAEWPR